MTQAMGRQHYLPLLENIRGRISTWTCRFLSYAGRLQLIKSVIMSIVNFWATVFRLQSQCSKETEKLCSACLWTGPELKSTGAKVVWQDICKTKSEGGLGIRPLKEVNHVYGVKLIWRMLAGDSLWGKWIRTNLLRNKSFWEVNEKTQAGSWTWRKMLKLRHVARTFHMKAVGNGRHISFWFDRWSELGVMSELLGERGTLEMGIRRETTLEEAVCNQRRRKRHRRLILNDTEKEMDIVKGKLRSGTEDVDLWRWKSSYKTNFSTTETW